MSRKSTICKRGYEHTDFNDLLSELQGKNSFDIIADVAVGAESNAITGTEADTISVTKADEQAMTFSCQNESEERHRIMSNPEIKYLYSKHSDVIHDKHCNCAKVISDENLKWSNEYIPSFRPCPICRVRAYIAVGAKDPEEIDMYLQFFERAKMTNGQIRSIYVEYGMKTRIFKDVMTIWYGEDTWRIRVLPKKGRVQLYHNNYTVRKKGVREFTKGFHIQNTFCEDTNISYALKIIRNYEYKPEEYILHINRANLTEKEKIKQTQLKNMKQSVTPLKDMEQPAASLENMAGEQLDSQTIWQKIKDLFDKLFKIP